MIFLNEWTQPRSDGNAIKLRPKSHTGGEEKKCRMIQIPNPVVSITISDIFCALGYYIINYFWQFNFQ